VSSQPVFFSLLDLIDGAHARIPIICQSYNTRRFSGNRRGPRRSPQLRGQMRNKQDGRNHKKT
jgi:hypothetical protein